MSLSQKQAIFSLNVAKLIIYIYEKGFLCSLGEVYRTPAQAEAYARQGIGIKDSLHCKKLAIDINLFSGDGKYFPDTHDYEPFGEYWESLNPKNKWGGRFPQGDGNHFQMKE